MLSNKSPKFKSYTLFISLLLILCTNIQSRTIKVDQNGSGDFQTIQEGIDVVQDGDLVYVYPGIYKESLVIPKETNLSIVGSHPEATAIYSSGSVAITLENGYWDYQKEVNIIGFSITSAGDVGILCGESSICGINNCIISGGQAGVYCTDLSRTSITNCVITACGGAGIVIDTYPYTLTVTNCIINDNSGYGIFYKTGMHEQAIFSYCNMWKNTLGPHGGDYGRYEENLVWGSGMFENNPGFINPGMDYHLASNSPCIDKGKPGFASLDPDGTQNDLGAYGGPNASFIGFLGPVVTDLNVSPSIVKQGETIIIKATGKIK